MQLLGWTQISEPGQSDLQIPGLWAGITFHKGCFYVIDAEEILWRLGTPIEPIPLVPHQRGLFQPPNWLRRLFAHR